MRIESSTGLLFFAGVSIGPNCDPEAVVTNVKNVAIIPAGTSNDWQTLSFEAEPHAFVSAHFLNGRLKLISLVLLQPHESMTPWGWDGEDARRVYHDGWLREQLGKPPYLFHWGEVSSEFSPTSGLNEICI